MRPQVAAFNPKAVVNARSRAAAALGRPVAVFVLGLLPLGGCTPLTQYFHNGFKVGPNYQTPPAPIALDWIDANDVHVRKSTDDLSAWWKVFDNPELTSLVCASYNQNLTLRQAGLQILQARAERGIVVGQLFPQTQQMTGDYLREATSRETAGRNLSTSGTRFFGQWDYGFNLSWELDFWGRFRRAVEAANDNLDVSVANYDDVLVSLVSDVAATYVTLCTTRQRLRYVNMNIALQSKVVESVKLNPNTTSVDYQQALSTLRQTQALIPPLEISLRQDSAKLCTLLGIPQEDMAARLQLEKIPQAPPDVVVGMPAELLRRRPDVRRAERKAAAESAAIGIAESEFYPHIAVTGTLAYSAADFNHLFSPRAMNGVVGPTFRWNVLNYGRILNGVRREEAIFGQLVLAYQNTVLNANAEVERALAVFLRSQVQRQTLRESVAATQIAVNVLMEQMKAGLIDYNRIALLQQNLVQQQDQEAVASGNVALGLIQVYRALGGGWEIRLTGECDPQGNCAVQLLPPVGIAERSSERAD